MKTIKEVAAKLAKKLAKTYDVSEVVDALDKAARKLKPAANTAEAQLQVLKAPPGQKQAVMDANPGRFGEFGKKMRQKSADEKAKIMAQIPSVDPTQFQKPKIPSLNEMLYKPEWQEEKPESVGAPKLMFNRRYYKENENRVLGKEHMAPGWESHNERLVNGLKPDTGLEAFADKHGETLTPGVRIATHSDGGKVLVKPALSRAEYKAVSGKFDPHEHFLNPEFTSAHREAAYQKLADKFFGMGDHVPETAVFKHPNGEYHSAHRFIGGTSPFYKKVQDFHGNFRDQHKYLQDKVGNHTIEKLAIMNNVLGNNDRHYGNVMVGRNHKLYMIDHGLAFDYGEMGHSKYPSYAEAHMAIREPVHDDTHTWLDQMDHKKLAQHMASMKMEPKLIASAVNRLREIQDWSKRERQSKALGKQQHHGVLADALHLGWMHTHQDNELRPKADIDKEREALVGVTI